jgi:carbamoyltransferase
MLTIGINMHHDSSAALVENGIVLDAVAEERFSRIKHDGSFPSRAINWLLEKHKLNKGEIVVTLSENRANPIKNLGNHYGNLMHIPFYIKEKALKANIPRELKGFKEAVFVPHELGHARSVFGSCEFKKSSIIVLDGAGTDYGKAVSGGIYYGKGKEIELLEYMDVKRSLGFFYGGLTVALGWHFNDGEWKTMGLAPYGKEYIKDLENLWKKERWDTYYGNMEKMGEIIKKYKKEDIALTAQKILEREVVSICEKAVELTGCRNICIAGGIALNVKANKLLMERGYHVFPYPNPGDSGLAVGTALELQKEKNPIDAIYYGPDFDFKRGEKIDPVQTAVDLLEKGKVIGWFQGKVEWGPRALGNRSILADPSKADMKDVVNKKVKFREWWRPFAPSLLENKMNTYLEGAKKSPYMVMGFNAKNKEKIPAVVHVDGTTRPQTVNKNQNKIYYNLIKNFKIPVVMNTSFNLSGEPIVCTPQDAIKTFEKSGLDALIIGDRILEKK